MDHRLFLRSAQRIENLALFLDRITPEGSRVWTDTWKKKLLDAVFSVGSSQTFYLFMGGVLLMPWTEYHNRGAYVLPADVETARNTVLSDWFCVGYGETP